MAKVICFLLAVLCGLASINVSFAEPSTMYGAAPAKYPAAPTPATYPAAPAKYEAPAPPAPTPKYETPTTTTAKYEAEKPKYEEMKKEEYPMKMEYKTEEKPAEYKKEKKTEYPSMKMAEYGGKKYRRSIIDDEGEEQVQFDKNEDFIKTLSKKEVKAVRDAVIMKLFSSQSDASIPLMDKEFVRDAFTTFKDPGLLRNIWKVVYRDSQESDPGLAKDIWRFIWRDIQKDPGLLRNIWKVVYRDSQESDPGLAWRDIQKDPGLLRNLWGVVWRDTQDYNRLKANVRETMMTAADNDFRLGQSFGKAFDKKAAGGVGSFIGSKIRGGDPFSVTIQDLVKMYGRDPAKGGKYWLRTNDGRFKLWSDDQEMLMDDDMDF